MLDWLLSYAAHSTLLLGAAWLLSTRTRSHLVREALWKTALFGAFFTATAQTALGVRPLAGRVALTAAPAQAGGFVLGGKDFSGAEPAVLAPVPAAASSEPAAAPPASLLARLTRLSTPNLVVLVWVTLVAVLLLVYLLRRALLARRIAHRRPVMTHPLAELLRTLSAEVGITRPIRLTVSPRLASPIALGSSEIAVPEAALTELDPDQQRGMLAHELAHLERRDPAWLVLAALAERIGFFQPLNRLARRRIQESAEYLCDEWAVRRTGSGLFLAKCLAKVAEWMDTSPSAFPVAGMAEERSHLVARVRRLLDGGPFPTNPRRRTVALLAGVGVLAVTLAVPAISLAGAQSEGSRGDAQQTNSDRGDKGTALRQQADTGRAVIRALMEAAKDSDVEVRRSALHSLANYEDPSTVGVFREVLRDPDPEIRAIAIRALAELKDRGSVAVIAALLKDENTRVRRDAAEALSELPASSARGELIAALKDPDAEVRSSVIRALGELKDPSSVDALTGALKDPKPDVRARALEALRDLDLTTPPDGVLELLRDPSAEVRHEAAHAAGHWQDVRAVPQLKNLLEDPNQEVREAAVEALAEIHDEAAIEALLNALKSKDPKVRRAAADALGKHE